MKWFLVFIPAVALFSVTGCSDSQSQEGAAGAASLGLTDPDLEKLQGTWRIESSTWNGVEDPGIARSVTVHFQADKFIVVAIG
jgi:hypothetical protein